jgi:uncharacterized PurR-regulated membrane protein YhhQ (DUF165 family)
MLGLISLVGFIATIPAANWLVQNVGLCVPDGPCLVPVLPGLMAPSGVLLVGVALVLRDVLHRAYGWEAAVAAIFAGAGLSAYLAPPALVWASTAAFLLSEFADAAVYQPLYKRRLIVAVLLSGLAGSIVDSVMFLWLAFGDLSFVLGQVVGKLEMTALGALLLLALNARRPAHG